ncbi:MAG: C40 family peptidase [Humidesulfovibrio sp.]|jgi:cell wall-associated NlpC family hydrolase|uniref:C40 family peptidase n=1 Tax=Humidesulfovibrio sp. TaxID=2910988 RepID=UPI002732E7C0|nr:C40 family peptidase [Humidesulfovibrio sp.]MDP2848398.1 C40 family peptidase [Humidesulfovibrio sp.]
MNAIRSIAPRHAARAALLLLLGIFSWGLGGCAPAHIPLDPAPALPSAGKNSAVAAARSLTGVRYKWGGESPQTGFDCSGLTWWTYRQLGVQLPRVSYEQYEVGQAVGRRDIRPGDLVFFRLPGNPKNMHVGIATERGTFIHSPREGGKVREDPMDLPYWRERYIGARRVVRTDG